MTDSDDEMNRRRRRCRCCRRTNSSGCGKEIDIFSMMQFPGK